MDGMPKTSAGILLYRKTERGIEFLLAHPGGPLFAKKDDGFWSIPKGELKDDEDMLAAAKREFKEETGILPEGTYRELGTVTQLNGKIVHAWAVESNCDPATLHSNLFSMEWPPHSGKRQEFPEMDRFGFFTLEEASRKIYVSQLIFLERLLNAIDGNR